MSLCIRKFNCSTLYLFNLGFFVLGSASYMKWKLSKKFKESEYFQLATKSLNGNETAMGFLGKPIIFGNLDLGDTENNHCDGFKAKFSVPVRGPKNSGTMHLEASRSAISDPWNLNKLEFVDKNSTKKLVLVQTSSTSKLD